MVHVNGQLKLYTRAHMVEETIVSHDLIHNLQFAKTMNEKYTTG